MTDPQISRPEDSEVDAEEKKFHGWRLLGYIMLVVLVLAIVAGVVDWMVLGPLLGRAL